MNPIEQILEYNQQFVENKSYEQYQTTRFPDKRMVILTCMDTRLVELLPKAMNLKNGDAKIIKNAGAIVARPIGNIMRSIIVAVYEMKATEIIVVGHHDCGMVALDSDRIIQNMFDRGIPQDVMETMTLAGIDIKRWLTGFETVLDGVTNSVRIIKTHPLLPKDVNVHGMIIDPKTGKLDYVVQGYQ